MKVLKERILKEGRCYPGGILKVDKFINHQMDPNLMKDIAVEFIRRFASSNVNKILTIEASGIGIACITAQYFHVPVVFAKKTKTNNIYADVYTSRVESYTHQKTYDIVVSKEFLGRDDRVLIIDDFLAKGSALYALIELIKQADAVTVGAGIVIEKAYQPGGDLIRNKMGVRVESLARIRSMSAEKGIEFCR